MTTRKASTNTKWCESRDVLVRRRVKNPNSGRTYTMVALFKTLNSDFEWQCSCRGWTMHTPRRDCKHIRHAKQRLN